MDQISPYWHWIAWLGALTLDILASIHVILNKRDTRSATGWMGVIWLTPVVGSLLYYLLGINRVSRKAIRLRRRHLASKGAPAAAQDPGIETAESCVPLDRHLAPLVRLGGNLTGQLLVGGNRIEPLINGDQAYPAMLQAINEASQSVSLSTYIFNNDHAGGLFVDALRAAMARKVAVRVLIDDIGVHYSWPSIRHALHDAGIPFKLFLPAYLPLHFHYANVRSHRKILVADGKVGFTGGMNIADGNLHSTSPKYPIQDLHFRVQGPAVGLLQEAFVDDWAFATGELLDDKRWFPDLPACGNVLSRGIASGPDASIEKLWMMCHGALSCAAKSVKIVTPYFLPDSALVAALDTAALRGVAVDIAIPVKNNLLMVQWASTACLPDLIEHGCRVWLTPQPFDHTKLFLVDGVWAMIGSANWDPRSMRLNFEFNLECYDRELAALLDSFVSRKLSSSRQLTLADLNSRSFPVKIRDGVARLFTPYL